MTIFEGNLFAMLTGVAVKNVESDFEANHLLSIFVNQVQHSSLLSTQSTKLVSLFFYVWSSKLSFEFFNTNDLVEALQRYFPFSYGKLLDTFGGSLPGYAYQANLDDSVEVHQDEIPQTPIRNEPRLTSLNSPAAFDNFQPSINSPTVANSFQEEETDQLKVPDTSGHAEGGMNGNAKSETNHDVSKVKPFIRKKVEDIMLPPPNPKFSKKDLPVVGHQDKIAESVLMNVVTIIQVGLLCFLLHFL
jgi:hypothetical protein